MPFSSRRGFALAACALSSAILLSFSARAQSAVPRDAYGALRWRMIGPFRGGRALAVSGMPGNPAEFYFGSVDGGVWKSVNAGVTWQPIFDGEPVAAIGALAVAPSNPSVIYVGTGEADMRSDITYGAGVYKSVDGGKHWRHLGLDSTRQIAKIIVDPARPDVVLVAALGHAYAPNADRGVYRSTDGGRTWAKVLYKGPDLGAIDLAVDPGDSRVVFASLWNARRPPWSQYPPDEGPGSALYRSADGGATWSPVTGHGLPTTPVGRMGIALARTPAGGGTRVYALVTAQNAVGQGLYRSDDGGGNWRLVGTDPRLTGRGWYFGQVFADPQHPDVVYVPNVSLLRSSDAGRTFVPIKGAPGGDDYHDLWIDPRNSSHLMLGSDQGVGVSLDGGVTWSSWYNQPTAQFYHVAVDNQFPYGVYGAQQDAGTVGTTSRANDGSITFRDWHPVGAGEAGSIAPDPLNPDIIYGGDYYGSVYRYDRVTGQSQNISPVTVSPGLTTPIPERPLRFTWTSPLVFDPIDKRTLYLGSNVLLRTRDGGLHWDAISGDLTGAASTAGAGAHERPTVATAAALGWGVIYTVAPSPIQEGTIWAGSDDGFIHLTTDGGQHWRDVTPQGLPPWSKVATIEASPFDARTAYAAIDRHRLDDLSPMFYRTHDGGEHWTRIDLGIPFGAYAQVIREDPARRGLLYAGTELGAYVSFDDGEHWQPLSLNMPVVSVRDLAVHDNDLVAATHGRSFWILDDLTPLQQLHDSVLRVPVHLFTPDRAIRVRSTTSTDTPLPPEEPQGENPPAGAIVDYYLAAAPTGPVVIAILDDSGRVVRRFSSDDVPEAGPSPQIVSFWLARPPIPTRHVGHNRFVWDLRYPSPPSAAAEYTIAAVAASGTVLVPQGPLVLPGTYQVQLTVGGRSYTAPLRVEMDPRVHTPEAELVSQIRLALAVCQAMGDEHRLHEAASAMRRRLAGTAGATPQAALGRALDSLVAGTSGADFGAIENAVISADREPTQQARDAFASASTRLAALRARMAAIEAQR